VLGRKLELVVYDDRSDPATAARLYSTVPHRRHKPERLIDSVLLALQSATRDQVAVIVSANCAAFITSTPCRRRPAKCRTLSVTTTDTSARRAISAMWLS